MKSVRVKNRRSCAPHAALALFTMVLSILPALAAAREADLPKQAHAVLSRRCAACHSGTRREGGLSLATRADLLRGGDRGPAISPADPGASLLLRAVRGAAGLQRMPPGGENLSPAELDLLQRWIDAGAVYPEAASGAHWSFQPPRAVAPPAVTRAGWSANPVDRFILARLDKEGITPSPGASRRALIRRLSLDLTGLLPSPERVRQFESDSRPDAWARLIDELLGSPHFGERWGRHWLDLARYADSDGYEKDLARPNAYLYRDWVIRAINDDMPFDRFTIEQLAGDLLPGAGEMQLLATGFHRNTLTNREGGVDQEEYRLRAVVDRTNTTGAVWMGLTLGCAECHSHKYDPISQKEYYGLFAFFNSAEESDLPLPSAEEKRKYAEAAAALPPGGKKPPLTSRVAMILRQDSTPPATRIHIRGDFLRPGEAVSPHTPAVLPPLRSRGEGLPDRLDLARWLTDRSHPLTARLEVNRTWQALFGAGLVRTPEDWGVRGDPPAHPELLDWLAVAFSTPGPAEGGPAWGLGWSRKKLIRLIAHSQTYRQSSKSRPDLAQRDPQNHLLARQSRLRVEAEIVRDLALDASGLLNRSIGGPSVRPPLPADIAALGYAGSVKWPESSGADRYRRGMYIFLQRTVPYPSLTAFDAADLNVACTRRERSNTPIQALTLLNDPVFVEAAAGLGSRVARELPVASPVDRIRRMMQICCARDPRPAEQKALVDLYLEARRDLKPAAAAALIADRRAAGEDAGLVAALTIVARALLNSDAFITRE